MTPHPVAQELAEKVREASVALESQAKIIKLKCGDEAAWIISNAARLLRECADLSPFTQATGAGLPEEPCRFDNDGYPIIESDLIRGKPEARFVLSDDYDILLAAATALQERADSVYIALDAERDLVKSLERQLAAQEVQMDAVRYARDKADKRADNLQRELAEARKDAERYRHLREQAFGLSDDGLNWFHVEISFDRSQTRDDLDSHIDSARSERGGGGEMAP